MLRFREPPDSCRKTLWERLFDGTYDKPFIIDSGPRSFAQLEAAPMGAGVDLSIRNFPPRAESNAFAGSAQQVARAGGSCEAYAAPPQNRLPAPTTAGPYFPCRLWSCRVDADRDDASMTRAADAEPARSASTVELEAMTVLREIREHGGYVLLDLTGNLHVRHIAGIPIELRDRIARYYAEIVRLLLESLE
jgi:hypothetical protein